MELPNLGKHCAIDQCQQLDFLPLQCKCGKVFCSEHLQSHRQTCEKTRFLTDEELKKIENIFVCSKEGCRERSVVPLICQRCKKHLCLHHRHLTECQDKTKAELDKERERYAEPVRQFNEAKAKVDKQIENSIAEAKKKSKSRELASKLQLMKIKNKAQGQQSIPLTHRVYFNIHLPSSGSNGGKTLPVFVSKFWSLGRTIDALAEECKLQNNNNKPSGKKLRLFRKEDAQLVCENLSIMLSHLFSDKVLIDGDDLVLEYVGDTGVQL